jgi:23S rRNA pseudouridine2605 synthase
MLARLVRGGVGKTGPTRLHLKPIGRLDMSTEGLILVTNDGQYAREMELPSSKLHRTYRVRAHGILSDYKLGRIRKGITIEGIRYSPMKVHVESSKQTKSTNKWLEVTCAEGKNRMIRNVFTHLGCKYKYNRLVVTNDRRVCLDFRLSYRWIISDSVPFASFASYISNFHILQ